MKNKKVIKQLQFNFNERVSFIIKRIKTLSKYTNNTPIAFIVNDFMECIGTLTISDFLRSKKNKYLKAKNVMNKNFSYVYKVNSENSILREFEKTFLNNDPNIRTIPVFDKKKKIIELINFSDFQKKKSNINIKYVPKNNYVFVKIPARVSFSGGGTDFSSLINENKIFVISTTINKHIKVEFKLLEEKTQNLFIDNKKINLLKRSNFKKYKLIYKILDFYNLNFGFNLKIFSEFHRGSGLGGSSALTVAIVSAIDSILFGRVNLKHVINKSYRLERIDTKIKGGWQDFFTSVYGSFCWIEMNKKDIQVKKIKLSKKSINGLENNLLFFKFGRPRSSSKIQSKLEKKINDPKNDMKKMIIKMNKVTLDIKSALIHKNLKKLGILQNKNWLLKKKMNKGITNNKINNLYSKILNMGAYGGKILGAGNSGYLMINVEKVYHQKIIKFLKTFKFKNENIKFTTKGLQISNKKL